MRGFRPAPLGESLRDAEGEASPSPYKPYLDRNPAHHTRVKNLTKSTQIYIDFRIFAAIIGGILSASVGSLIVATQPTGVIIAQLGTPDAPTAARFFRTFVNTLRVEHQGRYVAAPAGSFRLDTCLNTTPDELNALSNLLIQPIWREQ